MKQFQKLTAGQKEAYDRKARELSGILPSTLYFESVYAWSHTCRPFFREIDNYYCILLEDESCMERYYYMPLGTYDQKSFQIVIDKLMAGECKTPGQLRFRDVGEAQLPFFQKLTGYEVNTEDNRGDADYIFTAKEFRNTLESQEFRYNRNYFLRRQASRCRPIDSADGKNIRTLLKEAYCRYHICSDCSNGCLIRSIDLFLEQQKTMDWEGLEVYAEGILAAYVVCVPWKDTLMVLFKKTLRGYRGLDEYLHMEMLDRFQKDMAYINYTEDTGLYGLRKYKEKWGAYQLNHRYRVTVRTREEKK